MEDVNERWNVNYTASDRETGDDVKAINVSWDNRPVGDVKANLNAWLAAVGLPLKVVEEKGR
jgi:hypothetical protein